MFHALAPVPTGESGWLLQKLTDAAEPVGDIFLVERVDELPGMTDGDMRWLWDATARIYPALLAAGFRADRCYDVRLTERILLSREGRYGQPSSAAAVHARFTGLPVPADQTDHAGPAEPSLFETVPRPNTEPDPIGTLRSAFRSQQLRAGGDNALRLLLAAESASALAAAEMGHLGLPLRSEIHAHQLAELLGPRSATGSRPQILESLAEKIAAAFGYSVNPDSPVDLRQAFQRAGFHLETTRAWVIRELDHPAVPLVLEYKELARLHSANGWNWLDEWVKNGRFHAEYLPGGVVSGRWAARGGGGLQIPKLVRRAVVAEPDHTFVVADAAQLEPRVLAAVSADPALQAVSNDDDLYTALAADGFGGDRASAKLAMLGAMYGATSGEAGRLLGTLRQRYPVAMAYVEAAARRGEQGDVVRSVLGRTSPPPGQKWWATVQAGSLPDASAAAERRGREVARGWGRFTRNFVVQGSAADWASVWLSIVRRELRDVPGAQLVFFQHDELLVHVPVESADRVSEVAVRSAEEARRLVFPTATASTPVRPKIVECYADAK